MSRPDRIITFCIGGSMPRPFAALHAHNEELSRRFGVSYEIQSIVFKPEFLTAGKQAEYEKAHVLLDFENVMVIDFDLLLHDIPDCTDGYHFGSWDSGRFDGFLIYKSNENSGLVYEYLESGFPFWYSFLTFKDIYKRESCFKYPNGAYLHLNSRFSEMKGAPIGNTDSADRVAKRSMRKVERRGWLI